MCLAQGHNAVMRVRLEPAALWSRVKHSTTESLGSLQIPVIYLSNYIAIPSNKFNKDIKTDVSCNAGITYQT